MAGELNASQVGQIVDWAHLNNSTVSAGSVPFTASIIVNTVGAGDGYTFTVPMKCQVAYTIWGSDGPAGGVTVTLRSAAGGGGAALGGTHHSAAAGAPIVEVLPGTAVGIAASATVYAYCSGAVTGYMLVVFVPIA